MPVSYPTRQKFRQRMLNIESADEILDLIDSLLIQNQNSLEESYTATTDGLNFSSLVEFSIEKNSSVNFFLNVIARQTGGSKGFVGDGFSALLFVFLENTNGELNIIAQEQLITHQKPQIFSPIQDKDQNSGPQFSVSTSVEGDKIFIKVFSASGRLASWKGKLLNYLSV